MQNVSDGMSIIAVQYGQEIDAGPLVRVYHAGVEEVHHKYMEGLIK